jgi:predicted permease
VFLKLASMPAIADRIGHACGLSGINLAVVACCASVPASSNSYVLARQMGGNAPLMAQILTFETALAASRCRSCSAWCRRRTKGRALRPALP